MASDVGYLFSLSLFIFSVIFSRTRAELFTALVDLENLVYRERELKFELENYVNLELERLNKLQKFLDKVNAAHEGVGSDVSRYLGHPVNSYLEIRRFYKDWPNVERLIQIDNSEGMFIYHDLMKTSFQLAFCYRLKDCHIIVYFIIKT